MFKTKIQFHTHLSSWICAGHFQGLMLEMTVEAISNSYCPYYLQWMAFPFGIHQEQCLRNTTALPQFKTWETCHPSPGGRKGAVQYLTGTVTQRWTDRLHPTSWAFSHLLNNYTNTSVWEKICNIICSKIIWQQSFVLVLYRKWMKLLQNKCDALNLPNEKYDA